MFRGPARALRMAGVRYQSSSSSALKIKKQALPQDQMKAPEKKQQEKQPVKQQEKPKKGFSSLPKVPSTLRLSPKSLLLDNLFSGYRPLTSPIQPSSSKSPKTYLYLELDSMDYLDEPRELEEKNMSRFQYSNYSFVKPAEEPPKTPRKKFTEREGRRGRKRLATPPKNNKKKL